METKELLKEVVSNPDQHTKAISQFKETYEGLQIGTFTNDVLTDIIENGTERAEQEFRKTAETQLDKSGITSPLLKANLLKGCNVVLEQFKQSFDGLAASAVEYRKQLRFDEQTKNQMKVSFMGIMGNSSVFVNDNVKRLQLGVGLGFTTVCNKSFDFLPCTVEIKPTEDTYYIYAKLSRETKKAVLVALTSHQENTNQDFLILWQTGTFKQIKF